MHYMQDSITRNLILLVREWGFIIIPRIIEIVYIAYFATPGFLCRFLCLFKSNDTRYFFLNLKLILRWYA